MGIRDWFKPVPLEPKHVQQNATDYCYKLGVRDAKHYDCTLDEFKAHVLGNPGDYWGWDEQNMTDYIRGAKDQLRKIDEDRKNRQQRIADFRKDVERIWESV
jgi:hypothetical protein